MKEISIHFSKIQNSMIQTDSWTRHPMLVHQSYNRLCIEPKFLIKRKLIMYSCYHSQHTCSPSFYLAINVVVVPIYPSIGEIVHARHSENSIITLKVTNIHINENTVEGHILKEARPSVWKLQTRKVHVPLISVIECIQFQVTNHPNLFHLYTDSVTHQ